MTFNHLTVVADTWNPYFEIQLDEETKELRYSGLMWEVLMHLSASMNFTYKMVRPPDGKWGSEEVDGSWNGMLGMLYRGEADMALGPFAVSRKREEACDFSVPLLVDEWSIIMPAPNVHADPWVMLKPFDLFTWLCIFTVLVSILIAFTCMDRYFGLPSKFSLMCGFVGRVLFSEPTHWIPQETNYQRVLAVITLGSFMILSQSYSGTLVSMFTVPAFHVPINSLEDLVSQTELPWAIEAGSMMENAARAAKKDTTLGKLNEGAQLTGLCAPNVDRIRVGEFAELCLLLDIYSILSNDFSKTANCDFVFAHKTFLPVSISMAVQSNSSLLERINTELTSLRETGMIDHWLGSQLPNMTQCSTNRAVRESKIAERSPGLEFVEVKGIFALVLMCLAISLIVFIQEITPWKVLPLLFRKFCTKQTQVVTLSLK